MVHCLGCFGICESVSCAGWNAVPSMRCCRWLGARPACRLRDTETGRRDSNTYHCDYSFSLEEEGQKWYIHQIHTNKVNRKCKHKINKKTQNQIHITCKYSHVDDLKTGISRVSPMRTQQFCTMSLVFIKWHSIMWITLQSYCHTASIPWVNSTGCVALVKMMSSNGNIFCVTGHLCGEFTGHRWIPLIKASDVEHWCFLWSAPE